MDKLQIQRPTQEITLEEFIEGVTDKGICQYCTSYQECMEYMGEENVEVMSGNGCGAFDNTVDKLKEFYLLEKCRYL